MGELEKASVCFPLITASYITAIRAWSDKYVLFSLSHLKSPILQSI